MRAMKRIASFEVNHNILTRGMYISRVDGDIITYDIRFRRPNLEPVMENAVLHSLEHLMATVLRNGPRAENVIYFGPMGCRTGCYVLLRDVGPEQALKLITDALQTVSQWQFPLPGATAAECGNYREHDLEGAKREAARMAEVLRSKSAKDMNYAP